MAEKKLPLRTGVGIIVLNNQNKIFVGKRKDNPGNKWQMPQGGVDEGEDFISAMKRELFEETSIKNIEIIKKDTYLSSNNFFSARKSLKNKLNDYGRNISIIMIK